MAKKIGRYGKFFVPLQTEKRKGAGVVELARLESE